MSSHFDKLLGLNNDLLQKCNWIKARSAHDFKKFIIEEAGEVAEAVEKGDVKNLREELGDLIFVALLLAQHQELHGKFTVHDVLEGVSEKIIRRNPHVFGDLQLTDLHEIEVVWKKIKEKEKLGQ